MPTQTAKNASGTDFTFELPNANGPAAKVASRPVTLATDDPLLALIGEVSATPTANTVLDRLKTLAASLGTISGNVDGLETLATALNGFVDGIEGLLGTTNTSLASVAGYVDGLEALHATLNGYVDGLETLQGTTNTSLTAIAGYVDGLEAMATSLNGFVDGLEALQGTTNTSLTTLAGFVDGLEALATTMNGYVDGLEALAGTATPAGENVIGRVGGLSAVPSASFNRPANTTAYASGQLVANNTVAGSVTPMSIAAARVIAGTGCIRRCRMSTTKTGLAGTEVFRVHLFQALPTVANGDGGAFSVNGRAAGHIGFFDVTLNRVFSDGATGVAAPAVGSEIVFEAGAGTSAIFALIEARGAYTPASGETFSVALEILRD